MSLVAGRGPISADPLGWFVPPLAAEVVFVEPHPRRVRGIRAGHAVIDTEAVLLVHRRGHPLGYAFRSDEVGDLPTQPLPEAAGFVTVPWTAVDAWYEEGRRLVHYPPNPYHRVDCRPTRRRLRVSVGEVVLVDTDETVILFETSLEPRLYVSPAHVRTEVLAPSSTTSYCNYKGTAAYWSLAGEGRSTADIAWSYPDPLPESAGIAGHLSFDATKVDVVADLPSGVSAPPCGCG
ncbi:DUF427 domain-containing protein [Mycolicibacterium mengxianglii]|uniref:DUF427 domain-containing protein n=1 Tax=Mycolicibacterium mengxianglii TaxID=2736649 RepID=UPI0018EF308F|nr:DUF427 domain-containing protein [Mycolicibacterium mengxianglii]